MLNKEYGEMQKVAPYVEEAKQFLLNTWLDRLTQTNAYAYYTAYTILISYFTYQGLHHLSWVAFTIALLTGYMIWTFIEYSIHRYFFHWKPSHPILKTITFMFHGIHHAYPRDVPRSITPLVFTLPTAAIFYFIFRAIFGTYVDGVFTGFAFGYTLYSVIHDSTHHFAMKYPVLKQLKTHHMYHHYFDTNQNFGVSTKLWDILFRTYVKSHPVKITRKS